MTGWRGARSCWLGVVVVLLSMWAIVLSLGSVGPAGAAERVAGYVVTIEGHGAERLGTGEGRSIPLEVRRKVSSGDRLITQAESRLQLFLWGAVVFVLGPDSQLELPRPGRGAPERVVRMGPGFFRLLVPVGEREARVLVMTPTAVASVRGAEVLGEVGEKNTSIAILRGEAEVRGTAKGGTITIKAGQSTDVAEGQDPTDPVEWDKERLGRLREATTVKLLW